MANPRYSDVSPGRGHPAHHDDGVQAPVKNRADVSRFLDREEVNPATGKGKPGNPGIPTGEVRHERDHPSSMHEGHSRSRHGEY